MERLLRKKDNKGRFLLNKNGIICYKHVIANFTHKGFIYMFFPHLGSTKDHRSVPRSCAHRLSITIDRSVRFWVKVNLGRGKVKVT